MARRSTPASASRRSVICSRTATTVSHRSASAARFSASACASTFCHPGGSYRSCPAVADLAVRPGRGFDRAPWFTLRSVRDLIARAEGLGLPQGRLRTSSAESYCRFPSPPAETRCSGPLGARSSHSAAFPDVGTRHGGFLAITRPAARGPGSSWLADPPSCSS
jgi:hypothetical protein